MILASTTDSIEVLLAANVTTNQLQITSDYTDHTTSALVAGVNSTVTNNTTAVTAVASPASSTQRQLKYLSIWNTDTTAATVTVRFNDNGTTRILAKITLQVMDTLEWDWTLGWKVTGPYGIKKQGNTGVIPWGYLLNSAGNMFSSTASNRTTTSGNTIAQYIGRAERSYYGVLMRYLITNTAATVTWAEVGIASGTFVLSGNQSLTTRGYTDITGNSQAGTNTRDLYVPLTGIHTGMDLFALLGNSASTPIQVRGDGLGDDLTTGILSEATARPSTMAAGTSFTLSANNTAIPTVHLQFR